jgi:hypothetical protein
VNKYSGPAFAAALLLLSTGCASHHSSAAADAATTTADATATTETTSSDDKPGAGHVSITGEYALEHDFVVDACQIAPPGDGLLAGYHMGIKSDGPPIGLISIALKDFAKDGRYEQASMSREAAVGQAMRTGTMGPLTLMVMADATTPLSFGQVPSSTLAITITNDGAKGTAEFTNLESQISMADIDPSSSTPPHGKRVSGSISWTCGTVGRIDPHMNDAVNGMFKKLIPPK